MAKKKKESSFVSKVGPWAFVLGLIIALVSAYTLKVYWMLGALGLVVGLMNISETELSLYLLSSLTFLLSANALSITLSRVIGSVPLVGLWMPFIDAFLANITLFVAPGAAVVALKALYNLSKD